MISVAGAVLCVAAGLLAGQLYRPLWFDEALTLTEFVNRGSAADIYRLYTIPNNHIVYNIFLLKYSDLMQHLIAMDEGGIRFFSVAAALASVLLIAFLWRRRIGLPASALAAFTLVLSCPFAMYGTAVRGYMLSFMLVTAALAVALEYFRRPNAAYAALYFLISLLAVGTIPSNLVALETILLLVLLHRREIFKKSDLALILAPPAALLLFYMPIWGRFLKAMALKEGWASSPAAAWHYFGAFFLSCLPLVLMAAAGFALIGAKRRRRILIAAFAIAGIPLIFFVFRSPAPFPRTFFPCWPICLYLLGFLSMRVFSFARKKMGAGRIFLLASSLFLAIVLWGALQISFRTEMSRLTTLPAGSGQDDFYEPYFMKSSFNPRGAVRKLKELGNDSPRKILLDFAADYPSILIYGRMNGFAEELWLYDRPFRKLESLGDISDCYIVAKDDTGAQMLANRFGMKEVRMIADCGFQKIFEGKRP